MSEPKPTIEELVKLYQSLDPRARAEARRALLSQAQRDEVERHLREVQEARMRLEARRSPSEHHFEPLSDDLIKYIDAVRRMARCYFPKDNYRSGDESQLDLIREATLHAMEPLEWLFKSYFRYEVKGLEHVPRQGRAIIVSNHGLLPLDGWFLFYEIMRATGRWVRGLTDWRIYKFPLLRQFFMDMGMVVGTQENGDALLRRDELVFIMPGGSKEAWKSSKYRYRLLWQGRLGFVKLALRNGAPVIPSANVGTDDTYKVFFDGYTTAYKLFRSKKALLPISVPIGLGPLPLPVKMTQYVGEPIVFPYPPEAESDPAIVQECQDLVRTKVYELIDRGLRERAERQIGRLREA
ncbi:acyltransferase family protein [Myxococcota bacterium]|nr:acyltransferase family protein [Myxococcota bacterium]